MQAESHDLIEIRTVYMPEKRLEAIGDLAKCINVEYAWLCHNLLINIQALSPLIYLRVLDVSRNSLAHLPDEWFWRELGFLQIFYADHNRFAPLNTIH
jgi:hypothetical protein